MTLELGAVWAPTAGSVDLIVDGRAVALDRSSSGVWTAGPEGVAALVPGARYGFRLDGGDLLPDPRSRWQPDGPLGLSQVDDPDAFDWHAPDFRPAPWPHAVLYELHVGTFSAPGTFVGAVDRLDHLAEMGVTHVELMPVGAWSGRWGWGYDGVCWWAPHAPYGTPDDLRRLVDACHQRDLAVLLDVVFNHLGPDGASLDRFGPYTREADTPWGRAVNLDSTDSGQVRDHIVDCGLMWLADHRFDGLRLDAVHALEDRSDRHLVAELTARVDELSGDLDRDLVVVAEWDRHDPVPVIDRVHHGWGCRAQWADDLHHGLHVALTGESHGYYADAAASPDPVAEALTGIYMPRRATGDPGTELSTEGLSRTSFVVCLQNHDQVGNRAAGERITDLVPLDAVMSAVPLVLLGPSVPLLFQGEEWAATSPFPFFAQHSGDLAAAVLAGRLAEFPDQDADEVADPGDPATYEGAKLRWDELSEPEHRRVLDWYRRLLGLRATHPSLAAGAAARLCETGAPGVVVMERGPIRIACNLGSTDSPGEIAPDGSPVTVLARWGDVVEGRPGLAARTAVVLQLEATPDAARGD